MSVDLDQRALARPRRVSAVALIALVAIVVVGCSDDDKSNPSPTPTGTTSAQARTVNPPGTVTIREIRNQEGTVIATEVVPAGAVDTPGAEGTAVFPGGTSAPGATLPPGATPPPDATQAADAQPTNPPGSTPAIPAGRIAAVSLDSNPATPAVDHGSIAVATGSNFDVQVVITPPEPYMGYQYRIFWPEDVMSYVGEVTLTPGELSLCAAVTVKPDNENDGIYGGCLRSGGDTDFAGPVTMLTLRCDAAGTHRLRMLTLAEGPFGTSLLKIGGIEFAGEIDEGFDVICT